MVMATAAAVGSQLASVAALSSAQQISVRNQHESPVKQHKVGDADHRMRETPSEEGDGAPQQDEAKEAQPLRQEQAWADSVPRRGEGTAHLGLGHR
ncbi:unnamed protein product [Calypogeia fissa]